MADELEVITQKELQLKFFAYKKGNMEHGRYLKLYRIVTFSSSKEFSTIFLEYEIIWVEFINFSAKVQVQSKLKYKLLLEESELNFSFKIRI